MSDNQGGTLELIAAQVARFFTPLRNRLANAPATEFLAELGMLFPEELLDDSAFSNAVSSTRSSLAVLPKLVSDLLADVDLGNFGDALTHFEDLKNGIQAATSGFEAFASTLNSAGKALPGFSAAEVDAFTNGLPRRMLDWTIVTHLEDAMVAVTPFLDLFGVIERSEQQVGSSDPKHPQYTLKVLHLDKLPRALISPFGALEDLYGFGGTGFDGVALFDRVASILSYLGFPALSDTGASPPFLDLVFAELRAKTDVTPPGLELLLKTHFDQQVVFEDPPLTVTGTARIAVPAGGALTLEPNLKMSLTGPGASTAQGELRIRAELAPVDPNDAIILVGRADESRLELNAAAVDVGVTLTWDSGAATAKGDFAASLDLLGLHLLIEPPVGDGFLASILPSSGFESNFDLGFTLGTGGFSIRGGGGVEVVLPVHLDFGVGTVDSVAIALVVDGGAVNVPLGATIRAHFGPFALLVENIGIQANFSFPDSGGNLGPVDVAIVPKTPSGIGVSIDSGGVTGGGFLSFAENRYAGAIELSVFGVSVKAFGVVDTVLPDGQPGFSFVIVIIAEFTPIQLGFGFTLLGVGGLLGINRTVDEVALGDAVRTGSLEHLLFPVNVVENAAAIINDLATVFPSGRDHQLFGPMAKLGWGTPTLISGDLGIVIEFPGPRIVVLGVVRMKLPSAQAALVSFNLAIAGVLDFPAGRFSLDASLYDSFVVGFSVSGDMAYRLETQGKPQFLLSIGGFNPGFRPPGQFPELRRVSVNLGVNGNPSLTCSGYFAITSNSAQFGASLELRAHGFGIHLRGWLGLDVIFIFSPFSFRASISAGVHVDFHGFGLGVSLHGTLSGPTPWHFNGKACVEVAFWEACLPVDITFGKNTPASLPQLDPWFGTPAEQRGDPRTDTIGLLEGVQDPRNWAGEDPPEGFAVVSLADSAGSPRTPIDPLGAVSLRQTVCPLAQQLEKFGEYAPVTHTIFTISSVVMGDSTLVNTPESLEYEDRSELFAPAHFMDLSPAEKLSMPSYDDMVSGVSLAPNRITGGPTGGAKLEYETVFITGGGERVTEGPSDPRFKLTDLQLRGLLAGSATARAGIRRTGKQKYLRAGRPKLFTVDPPRFFVGDACDLTKNATITPEPVTRTQAALALRSHVRANPTEQGRFTLVPFKAA